MREMIRESIMLLNDRKQYEEMNVCEQRDVMHFKEAKNGLRVFHVTGDW